MTPRVTVGYRSDGGNELYRSEEEHDDIEWNIRIGYEGIRYFEKLDRGDAFFFDSKTISEGTYNSLPAAVQEVY
ncbi:MAG: hypothetical protein LBO65_05045, partial [Spirochaetaceae bacterium]|nr:hypothetical protein [Spirochaetaceae bacterium]